MKDTVKEVLAHPIATILVLGGLGSFIVEVVSAVKGIPVGPRIKIDLVKK